MDCFVTQTIGWIQELIILRLLPGPFSSNIFFPWQNCYLLSELQSNQDTNEDVDRGSSLFKHVLDQQAEDFVEIWVAFGWLFGNRVIGILPHLCWAHAVPVLSSIWLL